MRLPETSARVLAIIPARGGSKGIPRKNLHLLAERPLIVHTLEHALEAQRVDRVVVSTDDPEIRQVAEGSGVEVIDRPAELASDTASSESALEHVLDHLEQKESVRPDLVVFLQCTAPIRRRDDIDRAIEQLERDDADSLLSVVPFHGFIWRLDASGATSVNYDHGNRSRRQDRRPEFQENGSIYVFKPSVLKKCQNRLGGRISLFEMDPKCGIDIDVLEDFARCETILRNWTGSAVRETTP